MASPLIQQISNVVRPPPEVPILSLPPPPTPPKATETPITARSVLRIAGKKDTTSKVLAALKRRQGKEGAHSSYTRSSESVQSSVKYVIRTGIRSFDEATGGIPFSKVSEIYGLDMCGKTALVMLACGAASQGSVYEILPDGSQKQLDVPFEVTVVYEDNENSLQEGDRLMVYDQEVDVIAGECDTIDQIFKDVETAAETISKVQAEDEAKAKKDKNFVVPLQFLVFVVDTIAGTSTREELKQDWQKVDYKRQPAQLREGFRNTIRRLKDNNVAMLCTNQVGDSFKPKMKGRSMVSFLPQDSDFSSFGGKALRYYAHLRVFVVKTPNPYKISPGKFPDGLVIHFLTSKNRVRMPLRSGRMVLLFKNAMCQNQEEWVNKIRPARIAEMVEREKEKGNKKFSTEDAEKLYPLHPPGGLSPIFSTLEHLVYMGFIKVSATKTYKINFAKYGISTQSPIKTATLQEMDSALDEAEVGDIEIPSRADWPAFYRLHETAINVLFDKSVEKMFSQNGSETVAASEEEDESAEETNLDDI
jgi:RecA/RadA recombinase